MKTSTPARWLQTLIDSLWSMNKDFRIFLEVLKFSLYPSMINLLSLRYECSLLQVPIDSVQV